MALEAPRHTSVFGKASDKDDFFRDVEELGPTLHGSPGPRSPRSNVSDVRRKLSYKMQAVGEKASELVRSLRNSVMSEEALRQEELLLHRMHEITAAAFIGPPTTVSLKRDADGTFGFQIGTADNLRGARVARVSGASVAAATGIEVGDIIVAIDGRNALGLEHEKVVKLVKGTAGDTLQVSVAAPISSHDVPMNEMGSDKRQERPKPPSYMVIRNKLVDEFGDETYGRCKRRVQAHMTAMLNDYNRMVGIPPVRKSEVLLCYANGRFQDMKETGRTWKRWAQEKYRHWSTGSTKSSPQSPECVFDGGATTADMSLESEDDVVLMEKRAKSETHRLRERLDALLESSDPPSECRAALSASDDDDILPQLSYSGVRGLLIKEFGEAVFSRNVSYVQGKLQEREMMMVSL